MSTHKVLSIMLYEIYEINTNIDSYRGKAFSFLDI